MPQVKLHQAVDFFRNNKAISLHLITLFYQALSQWLVLYSSFVLMNLYCTVKLG